MEKVMMELGQLDGVYPMEEFVDKQPLERALERSRESSSKKILRALMTRSKRMAAERD